MPLYKWLCRPLRTRSHGQVISEAEAHHHLGKGPTLIKICGVTTPEDAELAARAGADFIGMIMWSKAKRAVSVEKARQIVERTKQHHAQPAGVFVDEDAGDTSCIPDVEIYGHALKEMPTRKGLCKLPLCNLWEG